MWQYIYNSLVVSQIEQTAGWKLPLLYAFISWIFCKEHITRNGIIISAWKLIAICVSFIRMFHCYSYFALLWPLALNGATDANYAVKITLGTRANFPSNGLATSASSDNNFSTLISL
jgi:hypothetical protein